MEGYLKVNEAELYKHLKEINTKLDTIIAKAVTSEKCTSYREICYKENIKPLEKTIYTATGIAIFFAFVIPIILRFYKG